MKTIIFFDVDNTIYNNALGKIPKQTIKLLKELSMKEDVILGLATGRGFKKLEIIRDVLPYFTYKVLINGAVIYKNDKLVYDFPILTEDILEVLDIAQGTDFNVGMVGIDDEAVNYWDERVGYGMKTLRGIFPKVDENFHLNNKIYQLWIFADDEFRIMELAKDIKKFQVYPWHKGGADFIYPNTNKSFGIKKAIENETDYQLICVGDGANDVKMIEMADIGIAMSNTRFEELKEKAKHLAPHIKEDQLYDFFKSINLI
jgi:peptidyl-prolyl cis-trans isomerase B (cyclophilin B)